RHRASAAQGAQQQSGKLAPTDAPPRAADEAVQIGRPGAADAAGLRQPLQPRGYIDAIAEDVMLLNDHVAKVHSDAECDAFVLGRFGIALGHPALDLHGAAHRINDAWEFSEQAVAGIL